MSNIQSSSSKSPQPNSQVRSNTGTRLLVLLGLLVLMLGALWYDYKVARPAVENAYERVAQLNSEVNRKAGSKSMTNQDVQNELKRAPYHSFKEGHYMVEVYGWRGGLPTNRHKYFAVYTEAAPYFFLKHFKNEIDMDELRSKPVTSEEQPDSTGSEIMQMEVQSDAPGGGGEPGSGRPKNDDANGDTSVPAEKSPAEKSPAEKSPAEKSPAEGNPEGTATPVKDPPSKEPEASAESAKEKPATDADQPKG